MKGIYLDYAAATPMDKRVLAVMKPYFADIFYNPSASYLAAKAAKQILDNSRASIAGHLGARPGEIFFTAGATEANNLAISGVMKQFPDGEVLVSAIEHESVLAPAECFTCQKIPVTNKGIVDLVELEKLINDKTVLVSVMLVSNELGTIEPLREISQILNKLSKLRKDSGNDRPLYLHSDAAQAANYFDLHTSRMGVDLLTINGGKIYGPKQTGVLFVRAGIKLQPLILGGGQEMGLRSGTENVSGNAGLAKALDLAQASRTTELQRLKKLREFFIAEVLSQIPSAIINGSTKHQSPHIVPVTFPGQDNERLMMQMDEMGVQIAVGSACSASKDLPSHVLSAIGLSDELARASLRISFGKTTTTAQLKKTVGLLRQFISA